MKSTIRRLSGAGMLATLIFFFIGLLSVFYGLWGLSNQRVYAIFYQTTARWVEGSSAVLHSWIYMAIGSLILILNVYFSFFAKRKKSESR